MSLIITKAAVLLLCLFLAVPPSLAAGMPPAEPPAPATPSTVAEGQTPAPARPAAGNEVTDTPFEGASNEAQPSYPEQVPQPPRPQQVVLTLDSVIALVDGEEVAMEVAPYAKNGTSLVPLRFLAEILGAGVEWEGKTKTIEITAGGHRINLQVGSKKASLDGQPLELPLAPEIHKETTMVPLRFISEALNTPVGYRAAERAVVVGIQGRPPVARIAVDRTSIVLGETLHYTDASTAEEGHAIVKRKWSNEPPWPAPGLYTLTLRVQDDRGLWSRPVEQQIEVLPPPNRQPVARFQVSKTVVDQGETVYYTDVSHDPDGDQLVEYEWRGREDAFFTPGRKTVTLRVKDSRGLWSEPYSLEIIVTHREVMDEFTYRLTHSSPGEVFKGPGGNLLDFPLAEVREKDGGPTLLFSNSPEKVGQPGVLYRDRIRGEARVYFWHANASENPLRFLVLAVNEGQEDAYICIQRSGTAGPSDDEYFVGRATVIRYLSSQGGRDYTLSPGEMLIINSAQYRLVRPGEILHGIYDLDTDSEVTLAVVALSQEDNPRAAYAALPVLLPDGIHRRGTFENADRTIEVKLPVSGPARLNLADGGREFLGGIDATLNCSTTNDGNYGVFYRLKLLPHQDTVLLFNPRGGGFAGAFGLEEGVLPVPRQGFVIKNTDVVMGSVLPAGKEVELTFMPPSGSSLPLNLIFYPVK